MAGMGREVAVLQEGKKPQGDADLALRYNDNAREWPRGRRRGTLRGGIEA